MAFDSTDLANVETAMIDLATGKRVVQIEVGGKTRQFQPADLNKLQKLRSLIQADVNNAADGSGFLQKTSFKEPS